MSRLRILLVALTILVMAVTPMLVPTLGTDASSSSRAYAAVTGAAPAGDNDEDNKDDEDNDDDEDNSDDGDNHDDSGDNNNNDNGGDNNDDGDDNDNHSDGGMVSPPPASAAPAAPACSTPGQEMAFVSGDGRVTVRVYGTMSQSVRFSIRQPIDPASVPPAPGPVVGGLLFQLIAESCGGSPIAVLPAEVNLGVSYTDADATGLNEANFMFSRLDTNANRWQAVTKQATDAPANFSSATIMDMGYYVLHQRS